MTLISPNGGEMWGIGELNDITWDPIDPDDPERKALDPELGVYDKGVQEITVSIHHVDKLVLRTKNYKVDRLDVLAL